MYLPLFSSHYGGDWYIDLISEGKVSFNNRSLHAIGDIPNPYEKAISIIGKTLAPFDEDNLIPCFGFGDGWFLLSLGIFIVGFVITFDFF